MPKVLSLNESIGNKQWILDNEQKLKAMFPENWTNYALLSVDEISDKLCCLHVEMLDDIRLLKTMQFFMHIGIIDVQGSDIRRGQLPIEEQLKRARR